MSPPHVAVVGAGWGGWGAAKALLENGCKVTLLDALPDPCGETPYLTPSGKPFEAGTRGFWKDYPNIEALVSSLGLDEDEVFTPFTNSSFYSPDGLEATAPVFSATGLPELPSPIGQVLATFALFERIPVSDRVTMLGLLYAMLDFTRSEETFEKYDRMTAHELFIRMGLSQRLVDDFVRPTLLVGLFKPPEELSAAVAMELLYFYALAHQTSFDVRWIKDRTIAQAIIAPLSKALSELPLPELSGPAQESVPAQDVEGSLSALNVIGGARVSAIEVGDGGQVRRLRFMRNGEQVQLDDLDACVLALGAKGLKAVMGSSPTLARAAPELCRASALGGIDVVSVRLWLDKTVPTRSPANVFSKFEALRGAGGTFFMLDQLQTESNLWGGAQPQGSVVACDFYNAGAILPLPDEDIVALLMQQLLPCAVPGFGEAAVVDSYVQKYPQAVTWFSPGSFTSRPPLQTSVPNLVCAGDWVRMGAREHGAKGLCQERALVSGYEAANALARSGVLGDAHSAEHEVIAIRPDEPQVVAARELNRRGMDALSRFGLSSPWVR
uniref:Amine oxidase domain-containing protein n=1 Tax=Calcidiscus leptoporus TaxID=127549 RepID=A0A7S0IUY5_9EUKA